MYKNVSVIDTLIVHNNLTVGDCEIQLNISTFSMTCTTLLADIILPMLKS